MWYKNDTNNNLESVFIVQTVDFPIPLNTTLTTSDIAYFYTTGMGQGITFNGSTLFDIYACIIQELSNKTPLPPGEYPMFSAYAPIAGYGNFTSAFQFMVSEYNDTTPYNFIGYGDGIIGFNGNFSTLVINVNQTGSEYWADPQTSMLDLGASYFGNFTNCIYDVILHSAAYAAAYPATSSSSPEAPATAQGIDYGTNQAPPAEIQLTPIFSNAYMGTILARAAPSGTSGSGGSGGIGIGWMALLAIGAGLGLSVAWERRRIKVQ
jgi:hypothetical protein